MIQNLEKWDERKIIRFFLTKWPKKEVNRENTSFFMREFKLKWK